MGMPLLVRSKELTQEKLKTIEERKAALLQERESLDDRAGSAETEEDLQTVEALTNANDEALTALETEKAEAETKITELEHQILELSQKSVNAGTHKNANPPTETQNRAMSHMEIGGDSRMITRGFFCGMDYAQRNAIVKHDEVQEFLTRVRKMGKIERAIDNIELAIPDVLVAILRDNLHRYSKLIPHINSIKVSGKERIKIVGEAPEGVWTEMRATLNEFVFQINQIEVDGYMVGGYIYVNRTDLEDNDMNLASEIMDKIGQSIGLGLDKAILYGKGKKMPVGIAARLAQSIEPSYWDSYYPDWTDLSNSHILSIDPNGLTAQEFYSELILALGKAKPNYSGNTNKFWAMNSNTYAKLQAKALVFNASGAIVSGQNETMPIVGGHVVILEFIPDNDIIGGYGFLYWLAQRAGVQFSQSEHYQFIQNNVFFKGMARYDGQPIRGEGFVLININGETPTTEIAFAHDAANATNP